MGLGSSIIIYLTAKPESQNPLGYDPLTTKKYLHELEVYGGKANVVAAEFWQWFDSLWHGQSLAYTVATLAVILSFAFWFAALPTAQDARNDRNNSERPGGFS